MTITVCLAVVVALLIRSPDNIQISSKETLQEFESVKSHRSDIRSEQGNTMTPKSKVSLSSSPEFEMTAVDGRISIDTEGNVLIDKDLKRFFDYFLSGVGKFSVEYLQEQMLKMAGQQLNELQMHQLQKAFDNYINYLRQMEDFAMQMDPNLSLAEKFELISEFRTGYLGETMAQGFFNEEEQYAKYLLSSKTTDNQDLAIQWLEEENQAMEYQNVMLENRQLLAANVSQEEAFILRSQQYGDEAARRLAQLDNQRQQWQSLLNDYMSQRAEIENQSSMITMQQLNDRYTAPQLKRLQAHWRIQNH